MRWIASKRSILLFCNSLAFAGVKMATRAEDDKFKVVIAVDGSVNADKALNYYLDNLHRSGNIVIAAMAMEIPYQPVQPVRGEVVHDLMQGVVDQTKKIELKYLAHMKDKGVQCEWRSSFDRPGEFITQMANDEKASLVVMGTRGMGTIRRTIMGSVSDYVVHHAHCPVIICRH